MTTQSARGGAPASRAPRHSRPISSPDPRGRASFWRELPILLVVAFLLAFLVKTFVVQPFYIPSGSMEDTLQIGDRVLVNKLVYHVREPTRGDVVVFDGADSFSPEVTIERPTDPVGRVVDWVGQVVGFSPGDERDFVKRVIGVGGDHVVCCDAKGRIRVNDVPLDEAAYLHPGDQPSEVPFDVVVPQDKLWVMGDHRSASSDSRAHLGDPGGGFVPVDRVIGRAFAVVWPFSHATVLSVPATFDQPRLAAHDG